MFSGTTLEKTPTKNNACNCEKNSITEENQPTFTRQKKWKKKDELNDKCVNCRKKTLVRL